MSIQNLKNIPDPTTYPGFLLWQKANKWEKTVNAKLKKHSLNQTEMFHLITLIWLSSQTEVTQVDLANFVGTQTMNTSKVLRKLESLNLIERKVGTDSRSKAITITDKGQKIVISSARDIAQVDQTFFPTQERSKLTEQLKKL